MISEVGPKQLLVWNESDPVLKNVPQSPGPLAFGKNSVLENPPLRTWQLRSLPM